MTQSVRLFGFSFFFYSQEMWAARPPHPPGLAEGASCILHPAFPLASALGDRPLPGGYRHLALTAGTAAPIPREPPGITDLTTQGSSEPGCHQNRHTRAAPAPPWRVFPSSSHTDCAQVIDQSWLQSLSQMTGETPISFNHHGQDWSQHACLTFFLDLEYQDIP